MPTISDYLEEAQYNLICAIKNIEIAIELEEDHFAEGEEASNLFWQLDEFLDCLKEAQNCKLPKPNTSNPFTINDQS